MNLHPLITSEMLVKVTLASQRAASIFVAQKWEWAIGAKNGIPTEAEIFDEYIYLLNEVISAGERLGETIVGSLGRLAVNVEWPEEGESLSVYDIQLMVELQGD